MSSCAFLIPGDLSLPTGGYTYDRRALALFGTHGLDATHLVLPASYPSPSASDLVLTAEIVAALPRHQVLLIDGLAFGAMPTNLIRSFGRPIVALCHHPLSMELGLTPARQRELKTLEQEALAMAEAVLVTSPLTQRILTLEFAVPSSRITVAMPGTDPAPRATGTGSPLQLLCVGAIVPRKGYDVLVEALRSVPQVDWRLTIAGADDRSPATAAALREQIAGARLEGRITVTGAIADAELQALYARADLFVMPSHFEGYGMVLAEALARGLPIVTTTGGAAAETAPADAAIKVPPGDAEALAEALRRALVDDELRRQMSRASWLAGGQLPRWEDTVRIIADVIRKVAA